MELAAYVRVSQDKTGESISVGNQLAAIETWAEKNGHTITEVYKDNDLSATSGKRRPDFERLLKDSPKALVVWHQDRLLRISKDLERILDTGMIVYQVESGMLDLASPAGKAVARTVTAWTTYEVDQKSSRQKLSNAADAAKGKAYWREGIRPFGHNMDGTLHPEEAPALIRAIDRVLDGAAITTVCRDLNSEGFRTNRNLPWQSTSLKRILTNKRIAGIRVYNGMDYKAAWKPIITESKFISLQLFLSNRRRPMKAKSRENLLTGIARCGTCYESDESLSGSMGQSRNNKGIPSYRCSEFKHNNKDADKTEEVVIDRLLRLIAVPGAEKILNQTPDVDIDALRMARVEQVNWWNEELREFARNKTPHAERAILRDEHEAVLAELDAKILDYDSKSLFAEMWSKFAFFSPETLPEARKIWDALPLERKRRIVTTIFEEVILYPGKRGAPFQWDTTELVLSPVGYQLHEIAHELGMAEVEAGRLKALPLGK